MTPTDRPRQLSSGQLNEGLFDLAGSSLPGYKNDILQQVARTRQRPRWTFIERWLPMTLITARPATAPPMRAAWLLRPAILLLLLGLVLALTTLGLAVGGQLSLLPAVALPPPTGPAGNGLIAFDSAGDIWVVNPDGSDRRQLTTSPALEHSPTWSADGTRLSFWSHESATGPSSLIVADADGMDPLIIATSQAGYAPWLTDWSPDGQHVAYSLCTVEADPESDCAERIFVTATDGSGTVQVGDPTLTAFGPDWSPDGTMLAFQGNPSATEWGAYVMAADGTGLRRLAQIPNGGVFNVTWSPDGSGVVTGAGDPADIWIAAADGVGAVNLTNSAGNDRTPWGSPDGAWVVYQSQGSGQTTIVSADGSEVRELGASYGGTTWSPDGTALGAYRFLAGEVLLVIDAVTGEVLTEIEAPDQRFPDQVHLPSWQRVAL